ncbi:MAG: DUF2812 domain-containing protein [Clostridia bacterium]|nr:DUF2812 domain-containing protein [Clostridia bacterium]
MNKRFFHPIWKLEEIEKELSDLEENGWRLNRIHGIRNFEFVKSKTKITKYFFTYSLPRERINMYDIENTLKQEYNATKIEGNGTVNFYRITDDVELEQQRKDRNIILQYILRKRLILHLLLVLILLFPLVMGLVFDAEKLLHGICGQPFELMIISVGFVCVIGSLIYNIVGYIYMKSKNEKTKV